MSYQQVDINIVMLTYIILHIGDRSYDTLKCCDWTLLLILPQTKNVATPSCGCRLYFYRTSVEISFHTKYKYVGPQYTFTFMRFAGNVPCPHLATCKHTNKVGS